MWRFYLAGVLVTGFFILGIIAALYKFWYITVPVGVVILVLAILLPRRKRAQRRERAQQVAAAHQTLHDARLELATALIQADPTITPARLSLQTELPIAETTSLLETTKEASRSPAEARPRGAKT